MAFFNLPFKHKLPSFLWGETSRRDTIFLLTVLPFARRPMTSSRKDLPEERGAVSKVLGMTPARIDLSISGIPPPPTASFHPEWLGPACWLFGLVCPKDQRNKSQNGGD